jgi:hypothetical protein
MILSPAGVRALDALALAIFLFIPCPASFAPTRSSSRTGTATRTE